MAQTARRAGIVGALLLAAASLGLATARQATPQPATQPTTTTTAPSTTPSTAPATTPASAPAVVHAEPPATEPSTQPASQPAFTPWGELPEVEKRGSGPVTLILIPGAVSKWSLWEPFMARNAERYTMYAITLPGFGGTAPPPPREHLGHWLDNAAATVLNLVEREKIERPVLVGHSLGAAIALRLAGEHPDRVGGAVAVDGLAAYPLGERELTLEERRTLVGSQIAPMLAQQTDEQWRQQTAAFFQSQTATPAQAQWLLEQAGALSATTGAAYTLDLLAADYRPLLAGKPVRVLLIAAIDERPGAAMAAPADVTRNAWQAHAALLPAGQLVYFEDTRHFLMLERPEAFDAALAAFTAGQPATGVPAAGPATQPATAPATEPATQPAAAPATEPATQPAALVAQ